MEPSARMHPCAPLRHLAPLALASIAPLSLAVEVWSPALVASPVVFLLLLISPEITRSRAASKAGRHRWGRLPEA